MLRERILTALVLAPLVLCSILFLPMLGFEIAMIGVLGLGAWEWANMSGFVTRQTKAVYTFIVVAICSYFTFAIDVESIWYQGQLNILYHYILGIAALWWFISLLMIIAYPRFSSFWRTRRGIQGILDRKSVV